MRNDPAYKELRDVETASHKIRIECERQYRQFLTDRNKSEPAKSLTSEVLGDKHTALGAVMIGLISGLISYIAWGAVLKWEPITSLAATFGIRVWYLDRLVLIISLSTAALTAVVPVLGQLRERCISWGNQYCNAAERADILASMLHTVAQQLPEAIPNIDDLEQSYDDDRTHPLVKKAVRMRLGQSID